MKALAILILGVLFSAAGYSAEGGLRVDCDTEAKQVAFDAAFQGFLRDLGVPPSIVEKKSQCDSLIYQLAPQFVAGGTVSLIDKPELAIRSELVRLPTTEVGVTRDILTVSKKEVALALTHPGRLTEAPCDIEQIKDHVGIRQNIVAWAERLEWGWPDGESARWNENLWSNGTPTGDVVFAMNDAFVQQGKYAIGCYTATKLAMAQGVLDYYSRINPNPVRLKEVLGMLLVDNDPLVDVEPAAMWSFDADFDPADLHKPGKLLKLVHDVQPENFIPGDWAYLRNTDEKTQTKTGYEGSNAIYLGRGKFDDYYNDHAYSYTYLEKLDEVYQWRNEVFSHSRDMAKATPLTLAEVRRLGLSPAEGGLVLPYRVVPYFYGSEKPNLQALVPKALPQAKAETPFEWPSITN